MLKTYVLIAASGSGKRMGMEIPKQFITVAGLPILMHTIKKINSFNSDYKIIVILSKEHLALWKELCSKYNFLIEHSIAEGGNERFDSIKNGLSLVEEDCIVAIHDGVRPFVSIETFTSTLKLAKEKGAVVPVIPVNDSLRKGSFENSTAVNRNEFYLVQTPQCFASSAIKKAYQINFDPSFTDDASVYENYGGKIYLCEGNRENIKITTPFDLSIAELLV